VKKIIIIILSLISLVNIKAQKPLTLEECVKIAIKNNHDHKQALLDRKIAEEKITEAYGTSVFPIIRGNAKYSRAIERPEFIFDINGRTQRFKMGSTNSTSASVSVEQPLFSGAMFLAIKIAKTYADISSKMVDYSEEELIAKVKQSYYTYLLSKEFVKLAESQMKRAELNRDNTKSMYKAGLVSEYDFIKANVQYKNMIPAVSRAKNQNKKAENNLKLVMGLQDETEILIKDSLSLNVLEVPKLDEGINYSYKHNKLIQQSKLNTKLKSLVSSYKFTGHLPQLNAFGNFQTQAQEEDDKPIKEWRFRNAVSVGLNLKIPIFNGFSVNSRVEQAELDYKKAIEKLNKTKDEIRNRIENTYLEIKSLLEQIDAYKAALLEAKRGYEISTKRYKNGLASQLEVLNSMVSLVSAKTNVLKSIHDYYIANAQLDLLLGKDKDLIDY